MAEAVVDALETIQVEQQQRRGLVQALAHIERVLRQRREATAVGQQRELIHRGQLQRGQLLLGHASQVSQQGAVLLAELPGLHVDQAQRAQLAAVGHR